MRERLFIRLAVHLKDPIDWCVMGDDGVSVVESGRLDGVHDMVHLNEKAKGRQIICLVPGTELLMTSVNFPLKQKRQIRKALPFMLEEQLVDGIDDSHFALPSRIVSEQVPVVVASNQKMREWIELFEAAQIDPDYLIPDCLALPTPQNCWPALVYDDVILARKNKEEAWACERDMFIPMMQLHLQKQVDALDDKSEEQKDDDLGELAGEHIQDMLFYGEDNAMVETLIEMGVNVEQLPCDVPISVLAENFQPNTVNLLQGPYSLTQDYLGMAKQFKPALIAIGVFMAVHIGSLIIESTQLNKQYKTYNVQAYKLFKEVFPKRRKMPANADRLMKGQLKKASGDKVDTGFLILLQNIYSGFKTAGNVSPSSISYDKDKGEMKIDINGTNIQALEKFKQFVADKEYEVSLTGITQREEGYRGRLSIKGN